MKKIYLVLGIAASMMFSSCSDISSIENLLQNYLPTLLLRVLLICRMPSMVLAMSSLVLWLVMIECHTPLSLLFLVICVLTISWLLLHRDRQMKSVNMFILYGTYPDAGYQIFYMALSNVNSALEAVPNVKVSRLQLTISKVS